MHHTTRTYILPIIAGTLISLFALGSVVWFVDPYTAGPIPHLFLHLTLFLTLLGAFTLAGIQVRKKFVPGILVEQLRISFRQAILLSILAVGLLLLQSFDLLFWWVALTLILFIITLEIFFNV